MKESLATYHISRIKMSAMPTHILHHKRRGVLIKLGKEIQRDNREQFRLSFCCGDEEYARRAARMRICVFVVKGLGEKNDEKDLFEKTALHSSTDYTE